MTAYQPIGTPDGVEIKARRMDFVFDEKVPRYWFANDPVLTHFLNVLSLTFPEGERFFVDSVRAFRDKVTDPQRQKEISGFIGQEAMHSKEHNTFNAFLAEQGYADLAARGEGLARMLLKGGRIRLTKREQLGATAALEHITAILAKTVLENPRWLEQIHPSVRPLWMWHCIEETEHKAVAFDLYKDVGGTDNERRVLLLGGTLYLAFYTVLYTWRFLRQDGITRKPLTLAKGLWKLVGYKGVLAPGLIEYFRFYAKNFHPWQDNNSAILDHWHTELAQARGI